MAIRTEAQIDLARVDDGEQGATFTPSVDSSGNISWTNDKGLPNPPTQNIMGPSSQYFWYESTGTEAGAHITEVPEEEWSDPTDPNYHSGGNMLARSDSIAVRDGLTELASFGASGSQIGLTGESHLEMDYRSIRLVDKQNDTYFYVSDLRDNSTGTYQVSESFIATDNQTRFSVDVNIYQIISVTVNGIVLASTDYTYTSGQLVFFLVTPAQEGDTVDVIYTTNSPLAKAYTLGTRKPNKQVGACSFIEGYNNAALKACSHAEGRETVASGTHAHAEGRGTTASGYSSHAEGTRTVASGDHSHADGYETTASGYYSHASGFGTSAVGYGQTAVGRYNVENSSYAVIVGNGTADDARSNALTVSWNGDVTASGEIKGLTVSEVPSITSITTGTLVEAYAVQNGKVVTLTLGVKKSTATAVNANVFAATIETKYRPKYLVNGVGYAGSSAGVLQLLNTGALNVHIVGAQLNANTNIYISTTYVIE